MKRWGGEEVCRSGKGYEFKTRWIDTFASTCTHMTASLRYAGLVKSADSDTQQSLTRHILSTEMHTFAKISRASLQTPLSKKKNK